MRARPARNLAKRVLRRQMPVVWGNLRRRRPFSSNWGFDRGLPVDRFYIESFLDRCSDDIRGRVLEVGESVYTHRFGGPRVSSTDVLDIDPENARATIVADVAAAGSLPAAHFNCAVLTQTLQYVDDPRSAIANLWQGLVPGGTLLLTVPCLQRIDPDLPSVDRWRFTPLGLRDLVQRACTGGEANVEGHGNVLASVAFLMGLGVDELRRSELEDNDPDFPLVACARVRKPS